MFTSKIAKKPARFEVWIGAVNNSPSAETTKRIARSRGRADTLLRKERYVRPINETVEAIERVVGKPEAKYIVGSHNGN